MKRSVTIFCGLIAVAATSAVARAGGTPVVTMQRGGVNYFYHNDHNRSPVMLTDAVGTPLEKLEYSDYGKSTLFDGNGQPVQSSPTGNPYRFRRMRLDEETGFYYCEQTGRTYDPETGRYICRGTAVGNPGDAFAARGNNPWSAGAGDRTMRPKGRGTSRADGGQEGSEVSGFNDVFTTILALMGSEANDFHGKNLLISILLPNLVDSEAHNIDDAVAVIKTLMGSEANDIAGPGGIRLGPLWGVDVKGVDLEGMGVQDWIAPARVDDQLLIDTAMGERAEAEAIVAAQIAADAAAGQTCGVLFLAYKFVTGLMNDTRFEDKDGDGICNAMDSDDNDPTENITPESEGGMWFISGGAMGGLNSIYEIRTDGLPFLDNMTTGYSYGKGMGYRSLVQQQP